MGLFDVTLLTSGQNSEVTPHGPHRLRPRQHPRSRSRSSACPPKAEACGIVRSEKVSGGSREGRTELASVIEFPRPGDELIVTRLDRLGRDTRDVLNLIHEVEQRWAFVTVLDPHVSTRGEMAHVGLTVLAMVAQMERRFIKERQRKGIERVNAPSSVTVTLAARLGRRLLRPDPRS